MSSKELLRNLLEAALDGDLTQNEWRVFAALLYKTIGFGKQVDSPNYSQIAKLTHIRKDRVQPAITSLLGKGVFEAVLIERYRQTYKIPDRFFVGEIQARFFAPSAPLNGKKTRAVAEKNQSAGTYRDTSSHLLNYDNYSEPENHEGELEVSSSSLSKNNGLSKPPEISADTFDQLVPALRKLPSFAQSILELVALAIRQGTIKTTPARLGFGLIKQAQAGKLNVRALQAETQQEAEKTEEQIKALMRELKRDADATYATFKSAGLKIPEADSRRLAAMAQRYQELKAKLPRTGT